MINRGIYYKPKEPDVIVGGCISIYENAWQNWKETIETLERECNTPDSGVFWNRATTIGQGIYQQARTNLDLGITFCIESFGNEELIKIQNQFCNLINSAASHYVNKFQVKETYYHEYYNALKYKEGTEYHTHYDGCTSTQRHISCILYLNDDYDGGELEFPNFNLKIKPEAGMFLMFPSNFAYAHTAKPVKKGTKYALVTWLHDQPIVPTIR
jgi:hypothetical protein